MPEPPKNTNWTKPPKPSGVRQPFQAPRPSALGMGTFGHPAPSRQPAYNHEGINTPSGVHQNPYGLARQNRYGVGRQSFQRLADEEEVVGREQEGANEHLDGMQGEVGLGTYVDHAKYAPEEYEDDYEVQPQVPPPRGARQPTTVIQTPGQPSTTVDESRGPSVDNGKGKMRASSNSEAEQRAPPKPRPINKPSLVGVPTTAVYPMAMSRETSVLQVAPETPTLSGTSELPADAVAEGGDEEDEDEDEDDKNNEVEQGPTGKRKRGRPKGSVAAVAITAKDLQDRILALQGLLTTLPKSINGTCINSMGTGIQAQRVRVERGNVIVSLMKQVSGMDRERREERRQLLQLGLVADTPPPPPLMSYRLSQALTREALEIVCPRPGTGLLNGALETSFIDRDLLDLSYYDERDPEYLERQFWALQHEHDEHYGNQGEPEDQAHAGHGLLTAMPHTGLGQQAREKRPAPTMREARGDAGDYNITRPASPNAPDSEPERTNKRLRRTSRPAQGAASSSTLHIPSPTPQSGPSRRTSVTGKR